MNKKLLFALIALVVLVSIICIQLSRPLAVKPEDKATLRFNEDGKFTVMVVSDCQDSVLIRPAMVELIGRALDEVKPDLVVLLGDNVVQSGIFLNRVAILEMLQPIIDRQISFAYVFGNHDAETMRPSKERMHNTYTSTGLCLTYNADDSLTGFGNCNLPILQSNGEKAAFNLWMIDSNMYAKKGYDNVHQNQLDWYKKTSEALENENGGKVPSIAFQHIIVPEIFDLLVPADENTPENDRVTYLDNNYLLDFQAQVELKQNPWQLGEKPCPSDSNSGQLATFAERGDVLGIVTGHDHVNSFVARHPLGIDLIQSPGASFKSYGDDEVRGFRTITLDENKPGSYETKAHLFTDIMSAEEIAKMNSFFPRVTKGFAAIAREFVNNLFRL